MCPALAPSQPTLRAGRMFLGGWLSSDNEVVGDVDLLRTCVEGPHSCSSDCATWHTQHHMRASLLEMSVASEQQAFPHAEACLSTRYGCFPQHAAAGV